MRKSLDTLHPAPHIGTFGTKLSTKCQPEQLGNLPFVLILRGYRSAGGLAGIRTRDLQIKSPLLYQLSYEPDLHAKALPL